MRMLRIFLTTLICVSLICIFSPKLAHARWRLRSSVAYSEIRVCRDGIHFGVAIQQSSISNPTPSLVITYTASVRSLFDNQQVGTATVIITYHQQDEEGFYFYEYAKLFWKQRGGQQTLATGTRVYVDVGFGIVTTVSDCLLTQKKSFEPQQLSVAGQLTRINSDILSSTFSVTESMVISSLDVNFWFQHPRDSDVEATLIAPSGTKVTLVKGIGGNGQNFGCLDSYTNCPHSGLDTWIVPMTLDDDSGFRLIDSIAIAPFISTTFQSQGPVKLLNLYGQNAQGLWTLVIQDTVPGDQSRNQTEELSTATWTLNIRSRFTYIPIVSN